MWVCLFVALLWVFVGGLFFGGVADSDFLVGFAACGMFWSAVAVSEYDASARGKLSTAV